jgi:hypothetical protein
MRIYLPRIRRLRTRLVALAAGEPDFNQLIGRCASTGNSDRGGRSQRRLRSRSDERFHRIIPVAFIRSPTGVDDIAS